VKCAVDCNGFHAEDCRHEEPEQASAGMPPMLYGYPVAVSDFLERSRDGRSYEWRLCEIGAKRD
jgi:hypothetical protein